MRVNDGSNYVLVGSQGGAPTDPAWVHNLRVNPDVEIRDETVVQPMRVREVETANTQDEADVLQGPLLISQKHCNKRTEPGLHSREKEIDPVEAAQTRT